MRQKGLQKMLQGEGVLETKLSEDPDMEIISRFVVYL